MREATEITKGIHRNQLAKEFYNIQVNDTKKLCKFSAIKTNYDLMK